MKFQVSNITCGARLAFTSLLAAVLVAVAGPARSADGLQTPMPASFWPQWQARLSLQANSLSPLSMNRLLDPTPQQQGVHGAALLGDYYFAAPDFGRFRASGGVMLGAQGGAPLLGNVGDSRWGLSLNSGGLQPLGSSGEFQVGAATYLGLGFTSSGWRNSLAITADVGLMSDRPGAAMGMARAWLGNQGSDSSLREMRLSPVLQLGLRYTF
jgi:hypothetical protein